MFLYLSDNCTFLKKCPECELMYHYHEWSDGLHNYNNHIVVTLELCILLQSLIQVFVFYGIIKKSVQCSSVREVTPPHFVYASRITVLRMA